MQPCGLGEDGILKVVQQTGQSWHLSSAQTHRLYFFFFFFAFTLNEPLLDARSHCADLMHIIKSF